MPSYVMLARFTEQGIKNVKESVDRGERFRQSVEAAGGRVGALYWTQGAYDIVSAVEFPDEDAAMATLLALGALGNVRTETLRAFDADDMRRILTKLG
jgi:uncharacterized protein with GYD domain